MDHQLLRTHSGQIEDASSGSIGLSERHRLRNNNIRGSSSERTHVAPSNTRVRDDMEAQDNGFSELPGNSLSSLPTRSSSWEMSSMKGEGDEGPAGAAKKDRRRLVDMSTPTLVDEFDEEEEEEMASLENDRLLRSSHGLLAKDEADLRRTPGAKMYSSSLEGAAAIRRTPGAAAMHRSAAAPTFVVPAASKGSGDASVLGFGLTLTTPVAIDERSAGNRRSFEEEEASSSSSSSVSINLYENISSSQAPANRLPRAPNTYTPASLSLSKNPNLEISRGAFSPTTMRLTETLDNLLLDDEDNASSATTSAGGFRGELKNAPQGESSPKFMFSPGQSGKDDSNESWALPFIFESDGGTAAKSKFPKKGSTRSRRRHDTSGRRSTNVSGGQGNAGGADFSPKQEPKPPSQCSGGESAKEFGFMQPVAEKEEPNRSLTGDEEDRASPGPLNFGGAFEPLSKENMKNFKRPVASSVRGPIFEASVAAASLPRRDAQSMPSSASAGTCATHDTVMHHHHQHSGFNSIPSIAAHAQPFVPHHIPGPMPPSRGSPHEFHFLPPPPNVEYQNHVYGPLVGMSSNAPMGPSMSPFPMNQEFVNVQSQPPPSQQFPPQAWDQLPPMNFDASATHNNHAWQGSTGTEWGPPADFRYGIPPPGMIENPHAMTMSPPSPFVPFSENGIPPSMEQLSGSFTNLNLYSRMETPPIPAVQHFCGVEGNQEFLLESSGSRPRVRSMDSISPANVPGFARGRMKSWDHGARDDSKKEAQRRKAKQRRQPMKQKGQTRNKKGSETPDENLRGSDSGFRKKSAPGSPKKKKQPKGQAVSPPDSTSAPKQKISPTLAKKKDRSGGDWASPAIDEPDDLKHSDLNESPRSAFKAFEKSVKAKERSSFHEAEQFALQHLRDDVLPESDRWRVYFELASLNYRANKFDEARKLYEKVCALQPCTIDGWLELSKLEDTLGHFNRCTKILHDGLAHFEYSDPLLTRAIKHEEKMGNFDGARHLLARLKHFGVEKVWKTVWEGALFEARAGNDVMAHHLLKYLMYHIPWHGPLYLNAFKLARDMGNTRYALNIAERGFKEIPHYNKLWFGAFRLYEDLDMSNKNFDMPQTTSMFDRATAGISRENVWKVHLDAAQILERGAIQFVSENPSNSLCSQLSLSRQKYAMTVFNCPPNQCWKVWIAGGRMELAAGNTEHARNLFLRAQAVVPEKHRAAALLECARLEEFVDNIEVARAILCMTRCQIGSEWKVWLESILLEIRSGEHRRAIELATGALEIHVATGRLWAALVQLRQVDGEETQYTVLKSALKAVPKSGEVWCEGARIHLNPFSKVFDLEKARQHLFFATTFTPQYGDSFLETVRLELIEKWISPVAARLWDSLEKTVFTAKALGGLEGDEIDHLIGQCVRHVIVSIKECPDKLTSQKSTADESTSNIINREVAASCRDALDSTACDVVDLAGVELQCTNADPNYGLLWFHCRESPTDTAKVVLSRAKEKIFEDVSRNGPTYLAAIIRRSGVISALKNEMSKKTGESDEVATEYTTVIDEEWRKRLDSKLLESPSVPSILQNGATNDGADSVLLEKSVSASDFITGLVELSKHQPLHSLSVHDRRKALFGSDDLLSLK